MTLIKNGLLTLILLLIIPLIIITNNDFNNHDVSQNKNKKCVQRILGLLHNIVCINVNIIVDDLSHIDNNLIYKILFILCIFTMQVTPANYIRQPRRQPSAQVGRVSQAFSVSTCGLPTLGTSAGDVLQVTMAMDVPAPNNQNIPVSTYLFLSISR